MDWKKLACMLAIASLAAVGCGDDDGGDVTDTDVTDVTDMTDDPMGDPLDCGDCVFVASTLGVPVDEGDGVVDGFDIDMYNTIDVTDPMGCGQADWVAPDGRVGIDNQLAQLAPTIESLATIDLESTIGEAIADGSIIILMELSGVENTYDSDVGLTLHLGKLPEGVTMPELNGDALAAGQTFDIDMDSVATASGSIENSVLMIQVPTLPLSVPIDETSTIDLTIENARVRATVSATGLSNGLIGGSLNIDQLVATVETFAPDIGPDLVRGTLEQVADLEADADGICQNLSVGLTFEAVTAIKGAPAS